MKISNASEQLSLFVEKISDPPPAVVLNPSSNIAIERSSDLIRVGNALRIDRLHVRGERNAVTCPSKIEESEWSRFAREHGRVPTIDDEKKPWQYRGWLLYYRLLLDELPEVNGRWDYWYRIMSAGKLLDEPIPQIHFCEIADREVFKQFENWLRVIERHSSGWSALDKLLDWFLWGFGHNKREPDLPADVNEKLYRLVDIGPMLVKPHDYIGEWIALQKGAWNPHSFYPTPHTLVEMMVRMQMHPEGGEDLRSKTVMDPCVGSGRMLMHASNYSLRLYGMDIDRTVIKVTFLNGALYVPWMLRPFPESFFAEPRTQLLSVNSQPAGCEVIA